MLWRNGGGGTGTRSAVGQVLGPHAGGVRGRRGLSLYQWGVLTPRVLEGIGILGHVLRDGGVANGVCCSRDAGLAAVAAATAVQAGHVDAVQVVVVLQSASVGHGLLLAVRLVPLVVPGVR